MEPAENIRSLDQLLSCRRHGFAGLGFHLRQRNLPGGIIRIALMHHKLRNRQPHSNTIAVRRSQRIPKALHRSVFVAKRAQSLSGRNKYFALAGWRSALGWHLLRVLLASCTYLRVWSLSCSCAYERASSAYVRALSGVSFSAISNSSIASRYCRCEYSVPPSAKCNAPSFGVNFRAARYSFAAFVSMPSRP